MKWTFYEARNFARFSDGWDALNRAGYRSPLLSPLFVAPLIKDFGAERELLGVCYNRDLLVAMSLLRPVRLGVWSTFQPSQAPLGLWVHDPRYQLESLLPSLIRALPGFSLVVGITQQDPRVCPRPQNSPKTRTLDYIQTAAISVNSSFDDYWLARDKNVRRQISRRLRRLEERGIDPRLEIISDSARIAEAIRLFATLETGGWKGKEGTAVDADSAQGRFYQAILEQFCRRGAGSVFHYWFGERLAASELCVASDGTLILLKTAYNDEYRSSAPGILMRRAIFEHVFSRGGIERIEFYGRLHEWQLDWGDEIRTMYHVNHYRSPWLSKLHQVIGSRLEGRLVGHQAAEPSLASLVVPG